MKILTSPLKQLRKNKQTQNRKSIYENILVTPNCMKELCMISQTAKAKEVRKYFIEMDRKAKLSILNSLSSEKN